MNINTVDKILSTSSFESKIFEKILTVSSSFNRIGLWLAK